MTPDINQPTSIYDHTSSRLNPHLKIDIHNVAVSNESKTVQYQSVCRGCNGGIPSDAKHSQVIEGFSVQAVRLLPYLEAHYTKKFIDNICIVKIDTEVCNRTQRIGDFK